MEKPACFQPIQSIMTSERAKSGKPTGERVAHLCPDERLLGPKPRFWGLRVPLRRTACNEFPALTASRPPWARCRSRLIMPLLGPLSLLLRLRAKSRRLLDQLVGPRVVHPVDAQRLPPALDDPGTRSSMALNGGRPLGADGAGQLALEEQAGGFLAGGLPTTVSWNAG